MRAKACAVVDVVTLAYRTAFSDHGTWLSTVLAAMAPLLEDGLGLIGYDYDLSRPIDAWPSRPIVHDGDRALATGVLSSFAAAPLVMREKVYATGPAVTMLSDQLEMEMSRYPATRLHAAATGVADLLRIKAGDTTRGTFFCAPQRTVRRVGSRAMHRYRSLASHLAAATRLRHATTDVFDAVLAPDGRVLHASFAARRDLDALRHAARRHEASRLAAHRRDVDALPTWDALIAGRWSLVEISETGGRRRLIAVANAPRTSDPRRLTALETEIARHLVDGEPNKVIAAELRLQLGTVSRHVHSICKKLGVRNRVEVIARARLMRGGTSELIELAGGMAAVITEPQCARAHLLTTAEREIVAHTVNGLSNLEIAQRRGAAVQTIANQLTRIYSKIGVHSRSELARWGNALAAAV